MPIVTKCSAERAAIGCPVVEDQRATPSDLWFALWAARLHEDRGAFVGAMRGERELAVTNASTEPRMTGAHLLARAERARLTTFVESCAFDHSFVELRWRTRQDLEVTGNACWEVLRNAKGEIARLVYVPAYTMHAPARQGQPRIFNDLLSGQPLRFSLFSELQRDLELASRVVARLTDGHVARVTRIEFEHSPGRRHAKYTGDRSAFDVFVEYVTVGGALGFLGVEVKYHEDLGDPAAEHGPRYDEVATLMGAFRPDAIAKLRARPLQQIWRDHLLVGSLVADKDAGYDEGRFVFLSPAENKRCRDAVVAYRACLSNDATFRAWTLEDVVRSLLEETKAAWVGELAARYLGT